MKLNGWQRIGIVLSVASGLWAAISGLNTDVQDRWKLYEDQQKGCYEAADARLQLTEQERNLYSEEEKFDKAKCLKEAETNRDDTIKNVYWGAAIKGFFATLATAVVLFLASHIVGWIRRGFVE
jgi:hypothetical protein